MDRQFTSTYIYRTYSDVRSAVARVGHGSLHSGNMKFHYTFDLLAMMGAAHGAVHATLFKGTSDP
jgi:hypothetical protein